MSDPKDNMPTGKPGSAKGDIVEILLAYWWSQRWLIARIMATAIVVFVAVLLVIPKKYKAEATAIVLPPRFLPEVRTQPLTVSTVKTLLGSGELIQAVISQLREARAALDTRMAKGGRSADTVVAEMKAEAAVAELSSSTSATETQRRLDSTDTRLSNYLASLSQGEIKALLDIPLSDLNEWSVDDLSKALESQELVEKKTASDTIFSPLIQLYAVADQGAKAQLLANTWAHLFERMYDRLTREKTELLYRSIKRQQEVAQTEYNDIQSSIVAFKKDKNLDLYLQQIEENTESYRAFNQQLLKKRTSYKLQLSRLQQLEEIVSALEQDGSWIGLVQSTLSQQGGSTSPNQLSLVESGDLTQRELSLNSTGTTEILKAQTLISRERLREARDNATQFYKERPLALLEKQNSQIQKDYLDASSKLLNGRIRYEALKSALQTLDSELSRTEIMLTLRTALPDTSIGNAVAAGRQANLEQLTKIQFLRQEINPEWQTLQTQRNVLSQEFAVAQGELSVLELRVPKLEQEIQQLQDVVYRAQLDEALMKEQLQRWQDNNEQLFRSYVDLNDQISQAAQAVSLAEGEIKDLTDVTSQSQADVNLIQQQYNEATSLLEVLELRQKAIQRNADLLLQKVQEAQIAVEENVSDVSIAARAVAPDRHYFPRRSILLMAATITTFAMLLGILGRRRYLELHA